MKLLYGAALTSSLLYSVEVLAAASSATLQTPAPQQLTSPLIASKLEKTASKLNSPPTYPQWTYLSGNGSWQYFPAATWTSGFFPATLYLMNTRKSELCTGDNSTGQADWLTAAENWMQGLDPVANPNAGLFGVRHDVGFLAFGWFEALRLNPNNKQAKDAINAYANALASRFNPIVGCTMSWDPTPDDPEAFRVIIDNMMNLEVRLFFPAISMRTKPPQALDHIVQTYRELDALRYSYQARQHDYDSTYHVVNYNRTTGAVRYQRTAQGYADNSTWTRGQSWGIHGYATMYNYTGDSNYWVTSRRLAEYYLSRLPESGVPPWDFDAPAVPERPSDTSSATIAASGMLMLSRFEQAASNTTGADYWANAAVRLLASTTSLAWREELNWDSLLSNGTVNNPGKPPNNNTGIVYGDYYYVKSGNELLSQGLLNCSNGQAPAASSPAALPGPVPSSNAASKKERSSMWSWLLLGGLAAHLMGGA
ncbi:hypothetical protein FRC07_001192 [Ceratobasidium sp. 392]|nr:hypothetical protein FRC07_001192 [Ceratobasidium sp. 392]